MRDIEIGGERLTISASPLTGLIYKQEFGTSLLLDLDNCSERMDRYTLLQVAWAMAKTLRYRLPFPSFADWAAVLKDIDFSDPEPFYPIIEEINQGFFRGAVKSDTKQEVGEGPDSESDSGGQTAGD